MNTARLITRNLRYHARAGLLTAAACALGTMVIVGALTVGDSVRCSLKGLVTARLGRTEYAVRSRDGFFRAALAAELAAELRCDVAPLLILPGVLVSPDTGKRLTNVQVVGVDDRFWRIADCVPPDLKDDRSLLGRNAADRLGLSVGDDLLLRMRQSDPIPAETPLVDAGDPITSRLTVGGVAGRGEMGLFGLRISQVPPFNVFVPLRWLAGRHGQKGQANCLLIAHALRSDGDGGPRRSAGRGSASAARRGDKRPAPIREAAIGSAITSRWQGADAGFSVRALPENGGLEIRSARVFLPAPVAAAAVNATNNAVGLLTYFTDTIGKGERGTPYSFISTPGTLKLPSLEPRDIVITDWLAQDLQANVGDTLELTYHTLSRRSRLTMTNTAFTVSAVVPLAAPYLDPGRMPDFPGLADVDSCRDWRPGVLIDLDRIRDKDEDYWKKHRGAPKAFVALETAQSLWGSRFGDLTGVRYPAAVSAAGLEEAVLRQLVPASVGMTIAPVREQGLSAGREAVDFGQLFLSLSFFLVVAAMLLTGLFFAFDVERRGPEIGLLLSLGFTRRHVSRLLLIEGSMLAVAGGLIGSILGILYNHAVVAALNTVWSGAVTTSGLQAETLPLTVVNGAVAAALINVFCMWLAFRRRVTRPLSDQQQAGGIEAHARSVRTTRLLRLSGLVSVACAIALAAAGSADAAQGMMATFFGAGSLLLVGGVLTGAALLRREFSAMHGALPRLSAVAMRGATRRVTRSLATVALLACGVFLVLAVGANRSDLRRSARKRSSGTGGFAIYAQTTLPVMADLNSAAGREAANLFDVPDGTSFVPARIAEGDDASCLNLNRIRTPRLLGLDGRMLDERGAFSFVDMLPEVPADNPWLALHNWPETNVVPAIADQTVITWGLGLKVGDELEYVNEAGQPVRVKLVAGLAASVFQGQVLISERDFLRMFPSIDGARTLLIDCPPEGVPALEQALSRAFEDNGLDQQRADERLAAFKVVENTYLTIFLALGGLGLVLGCFGLGIVVARTISDRRNELALLRAVGFGGGAVRALVLTEHGILLAAGVVLGTVSAAVATLPSILSRGTGVPFGLLAATVAAILLNGAAWILVATVAATRGKLISALREE